MPEKALSTGEFLEQVASKVNEQLPKKIDENTDLVRVNSSESTLSYHYKIHDLDTANISPIQFSELMKPSLVEQLSKQPNLELFRDRQVVIEYVFEGDDSAFQASVTVNPSEY